MMTSRAPLHMNTLLRFDRGIPHHDIGPRDRNPQLALVAGLHDNELNGIFVLSRLAAFLGGIRSGQRPGQSLRRRVLIVPGTAASEGGPGHCRADAVLELTRQAYYRVEIHNSSLDIEELPQVRLYRPNDDERASACLFGLPAVVERPLDDVSRFPLLSRWRECGGENFVIQAGQAGNLQVHHCEALFRALVAFMDRTGILEGISLAEQEEDLHYFGADQAFTVVSDQPGIFVTRQDVGHWVRTGDPIGDIYDGFTGEVRAELASPVSGLLSGLRRQPLLCKGDLVARIQMTNRPAAGR